MYKEEIIHFHQFLVYLMRFLTANGASPSYFTKYRNLGIDPHHIHKTKGEHTYAIFLLLAGISHAMSDNQEILPRSMARSFDTLADRCRREILRSHR
jgi:hypothetical protein